MVVQFALPSAVTFGVADFTGGLASRCNPVVLVTALSQVAGAAVLVPALLLLPGAPSPAAAGFGALAGIAGALGLALYLRGLAVGPMGVVAPLSSLVGAGLPLSVGVLRGERPGGAALVAIGMALLAIGLATVGHRRGSAALHAVLLGLGSGVGFGLFFVALDATPPGSGLWPLLAARAASIVLLGVLLLAGVARARPSRPGLITLSGALDMTANILFLFATRAGSLSVSAVLVSLYPVVVVVLARVALHERLTAAQITSVGLALSASALLSAAD